MKRKSTRIFTGRQVVSGLLVDTNVRDSNFPEYTQDEQNHDNPQGPETNDTLVDVALLGTDTSMEGLLDLRRFLSRNPEYAKLL